MHHVARSTRVGELPATFTGADGLTNGQERKRLTAVVKKIAPPLMASGRWERAKVAWKKYMGGNFSLRAAILVSKDYAEEFARFRQQGVQF